MLFAGIHHLLAAVSFGYHYHAAAMFLKQIDIRIHSTGRSRAKRTGRHSFRCFGRAGIIHRMILHVLWQIFPSIQHFFDARMCNIAGHYHCPRKRKSRGNRIFRQGRQNFVHRAVQIDFHCISFTCIAIFFRDIFAGIILQFFEPNAILVYLCLNVAIGRARYCQAYKAGSPMTREPDNTHIVSKIFSSKLSTNT